MAGMEFPKICGKPKNVEREKCCRIMRGLDLFSTLERKDTTSKSKAMDEESLHIMRRNFLQSN